MSYILVVSKDPNYRKLLIDNLVRRSYVAVGLASADEGDRLLQRAAPMLIVVCGRPIEMQGDLDKLHNQYGLTAVPVVLVSPDVVDPQWLAQWNIAGRLHSSIDLRNLVNMLQPWLPSALR